MATRRRSSGDETNSTPSQQDEADILMALDAKSPEEGDHVVVDEKKMLDAGAVDAASIRENERIDQMVDKKRGGVKGVDFNVDDLLVKYDSLVRTWPANTLLITVKRRTGSPVQWTVDSQPKTGAELYAALRSLHGPNEEATYDVGFFDNNSKKYRGMGRITLPDARVAPTSPVQGQPMTPQYPQQPPTVHVAAPPTTDPVAMMQQMFTMFQQMQATLQHQNQPAPQPAPQPAGATSAVVPQQGADPMAMMSQLFQLFQQMQTQIQPPGQPAPAIAPLPQQQQVAAPASNDPMAMMQQMFQMFTQMQQGVTAPGARRPMPQPQMATVQPQPAAVDPISMMQQMFQMFTQMQAATLHAMGVGGGGPGPAGRPGVGPYRGPYRPPYQAGQEVVPGSGVYPPQPVQPRSAAQEFRESISQVRTMVDAMAEIQSIMPGQHGAPTAQPVGQEDEDDPVRVMDVGDYKLVVDKRTGSARKWETGVANLGNIMKWVGEQREAIQKANEKSRQPPPQQLPPGYVEVTPGYVPPPGYGVVVVDPSQIPQSAPAHGLPGGAQQATMAPQASLPQPPAQMPPPISQPASEEPRRTWGPPTIPGGGN